MTEEEEFELRRRFEAEQQGKPTLRQKIVASGPARLLQGMRDPIDAGAQLLPRGLEMLTSAGGLAPNPVSEFFGKEAKRVDVGISDAERELEQARAATGQTGFDAMRMGGNFISPANLAIASKLPAMATTGQRVLGGALAGATGGALTPVNTAENRDFAATKAGQTVLGAGAGAVLTPIAGAVGDFLTKQISKLRGPQQITISKTAEEFARSQGLDWESMGRPQREALQQQVLDAAKQYAGKDPAAMLRIADFKAEGMPYTLGQVTRDPAQFELEKNLSQLAGTGAPLKQRFSEQGATLRNKLGAYGGGAQEEQAAGQSIVAALRNYDETLRKGVSNAYTQARQSAGKDADVPLQGLSQDFAEVLDTFGEKVPGAVRANFAKYGVGPDKLTQQKVFTVEEADRLLKVINANQSNDPATNAALSALRGAVKKSVTQDAGVADVFAPARGLAAQRFKIQDAIPALEASASGAANPDTFVRNFILSKTAQTRQVQQMAEALRGESPEAFKEARAQVGAYLQRKAFGENSAGDKAFSPERFQTALRELGTEKLSAFFTPQEITQMQRLSRIGAYIDAVPNASKPNTSGNWGAIMSNIPFMPQSAALIGALKSGMSNQLNVNRALAAEPAAKLSPQQIEALSRVLAAGGVGAGAFTAQPLK